MAKRQLHFYAQNISPEEPTSHAILFLPGRGGHGISLLRKYESVFDLSNVGLFSLTPLPMEFGWYPMPNGANDQRDACAGLEFAVDAVERNLKQIEDKYNVDRDNVVMVGFSAGAVVGLQQMTTRPNPAGAVICHSGACLEPEKLTRAKHKRPIVLNHGEDDYCFDWFERYVPMKDSLLAQGFRVMVAERKRGNHQVHRTDILRMKKVLEEFTGNTLTEVPEVEEEDNVIQ
jgi:predicted esterase